MSLFNHFTKKGQLRGTHAPDRKSVNFSIEEEDPEDDEVLPKEDDPALEITSDDDSKETYEVLEREIHPAKIICPDCGGITLEGLEFCDKCGGELQ